MPKIPDKEPIRKKKIIGREKDLTREEFEKQTKLERLRLIQELIPLGMMFVLEELQKEIQEIIEASGVDSNGRPKVVRYGYNDGSIIIDQRKIPIKVPRIRDENGEIPLETYKILNSFHGKKTLYNSILSGVSCRDFENTKQDIDGSIGVSKSTISRKFKELTQRQLEKFRIRPLKDLDIIAIFIDGKFFAKDQMIIALGITIEGEKVVLGFIQTATENSHSIGLFLEDLKSRGLNISQGILAIIDGSKGLIRALKAVFKGHVLIQRCQWHKRENILSYLSKNDQPQIKRLLQSAYERPTYNEAKEALANVSRILEKINQSAAASLQEGFEETLTLHSLGVFGLLGQSFKTTNCIESINSMAGEYCSRIRKWSNSAQKCRWLASALIEIEPNLRRIKNYGELDQLRLALKKELRIE